VCRLAATVHGTRPRGRMTATPRQCGARRRSPPCRRCRGSRAHAGKLHASRRGRVREGAPPRRRCRERALVSLALSSTWSWRRSAPRRRALPARPSASRHDFSLYARVPAAALTTVPVESSLRVVDLSYSDEQGPRCRGAGA
jgi:hypothetical protein